MESIGKQIGRLRQEAGVTQERLGAALGVTTQAVSRWECGGTPDASLLPAIADFFQVSIDELFGRKVQRDGETLEELIVRDVSSRSKEEMFDRAFELCRSVRDGVLKELMGDLMIMDMPEYGEDIGWQDMYASVIQNEGAIWMKSMREDRYFFLAPEPKSGFGSMVENPEEYEKLFALLGTEGCMKVLIYLYANNGEQSPNCSARWVSEGVGLPEEQVAELLRALTEADLLDCQRVRISRSEEMESYSLKTSVGGSVLFLLLTARDCITHPGLFAPQWEERDFPLLVNGKEMPADEMTEETTDNRGRLRGYRRQICDREDERE